MKHSCDWLKIQNDSLYQLEEIEQVGTKWIFHHERRADDKWVFDGEAKEVGEILSDFKVIINFCPYCGEKLNPTLETRQTDFHKLLAPEPQYPEPSPENFFQCPEVQAYNLYLNTKERWFIIRDSESVWFSENFIPATEEMVQKEEADYVGEFCILSGFDILFCPFCGELLDSERASYVFS